MPRTIEKVEKLTLPVIPLRGIVAFPSMPLNFELEREVSKKAAEKAQSGDSMVFLLTQKDISVENPTAADLYKVGCVARITHSLKTPDGLVRIIAEGISRGVVSAVFEDNGHFSADIMMRSVSTEDSPVSVRSEALIREAISAVAEMVKFMPSGTRDMMTAVTALTSAGEMADFIAANALVRYSDKQEVLECFDEYKRLEKLIVIIESETKILKTESVIHRKVKEKMDENQRDYYLREQIKVIQNELGDTGADDVAEYMEKIEAVKLPEEVDKKLRKEVNKFSKMPFGSPEATVSRGYIDTCLEIPWGKKTADRTDIEHAKKILDEDHNGLEKVKERILEFLAVRQLNPELGNQIICFVGPPGVGKTSLGKSIAKAMNRKYARVSLGGVRDESDIRGHRKTYIGSMPGRIINALIDAGSMNPLIQLDEIDKLCSDAHGDPASALLEVLDSEQNNSFRDHFIELPVDLSSCMFIASANTLDTVPAPLIDRMEIIELNTYTPMEKLAIAKDHLIPKQLKRHGLNKRTLRWTDEAIRELIEYYTRESGVRNLEREIQSVCRKAAKKIVENECKTVTVTPGKINEMLGARRFEDDLLDKTDPVGVVNGLAYTSVGGDVLKIESAVMEGGGKLELTGKLGDVMKESAHIAYSYIRSHAEQLGAPKEFYKNCDIHIHVPEGAVPKDGPSAGVTLLTSLTSALSGRTVRRDTAMTGELTLTGRVIPIGGLREKTTAAYTLGLKRVIIPNGNIKDLESLDPTVREELTFIPCGRAEEVLSAALTPLEAEKKTGKRAVKTDGSLTEIQSHETSYSRVMKGNDK